MLHTPLRRPKSWAYALAFSVFAIALWVLLTPLTASYITSDSDPQPHDVETTYSWSTSEQDLIFTDASGYDLSKLDSSTYLDQGRLSEGFRLACGNTLTHGTYEKAEKGGSEVCSGIDSSRRIAGISLILLGLLAIFAARRLPFEPNKYRSRYQQPRIQRKILRRGG